MQKFATLAILTLIGTMASYAQTISTPPLGSGIPAWQKGIGGPFPVEQESGRTHPLGLWVMEGFECFADDIKAIQIDDETITLIDPEAHSGSFSTENGGSVEIVDLSVQTGPITLAEPQGMGHRFIAAMDDGDFEFVLELFPDQQATMTFPGDFKLQLTACDQS